MSFPAAVAGGGGGLNPTVSSATGPTVNNSTVSVGAPVNPGSLFAASLLESIGPVTLGGTFEEMPTRFRSPTGTTRAPRLPVRKLEPDTATALKVGGVVLALGVVAFAAVRGRRG